MGPNKFQESNESISWFRFSNVHTAVPKMSTKHFRHSDCTQQDPAYDNWTLKVISRVKSHGIKKSFVGCRRRNGHHRYLLPRVVVPKCFPDMQLAITKTVQDGKEMLLHVYRDGIHLSFLILLNTDSLCPQEPHANLLGIVYPWDFFITVYQERISLRHRTQIPIFLRQQNEHGFVCLTNEMYRQRFLQITNAKR